MKKKMYTEPNGESYFLFHGKHYLKNIDKKGYDTTCFTNAGYFGGFRLTGFEYGINDYVILELVYTTFKV